MTLKGNSKKEISNLDVLIIKLVVFALLATFNIANYGQWGYRLGEFDMWNGSRSDKYKEGVKLNPMSLH